MDFLFVRINPVGEESFLINSIKSCVGVCRIAASVEGCVR